MANNEKIGKNFIYDGLGFPITLESVLLCKIRGKWLPKIDIEALADAVFKMLPSKGSRLTGNEIKFIRNYLGKSKTAFSEIFKLSHTAVTKWEKSEDSVAPISPSQEVVLRLYLEDFLNVSNREFYKVYKSIENSVHCVEESLLRVAL